MFGFPFNTFYDNVIFGSVYLKIVHLRIPFMLDATQQILCQFNISNLTVKGILFKFVKYKENLQPKHITRQDMKTYLIKHL